MTNAKAVVLARVSTKEQEELGHSLPAQLTRLHDHARKKGFEVVKEFAFSESAGVKIRKKFEEVLAFLRAQSPMPALLCENVDRITRNFRDAVDLDDLRLNHGLEIHFVQEGFVLSARASGSEMFMWEAKVFLAKQYINRLTDDAKRSIRYKIEKGEWIAKAPVGYANTTDEAGRKTVAVDVEQAYLVKRVFAEYATGIVSLRELQRKAIGWGLCASKGRSISLQTLSYMLSNPFYRGFMRINGQLHRHAYPSIIDPDTFEACQRVPAKSRRPEQAIRETKQDFVLRGLVTCAGSGRKATCDLKKGKYVYLIADDPSDPAKKLWVKEETVLSQIRAVLSSIRIPEEVMAEITGHLRTSHDAEVAFHHDRIGTLEAESRDLRAKLDRLTDLLLDEGITRDMYDRKHREIAERQRQIGEQLQDSHEADSEFKMALSGLLSLASKAADLFESSNNAEKRSLIGFTFSNLQLEGATLKYSLRKPFDMFVDLNTRQKWLPELDSNQRPFD